MLLAEDEVPAPDGVIGLEDLVGGGHGATLARTGAKVNSGTSYFPRARGRLAAGRLRAMAYEKLRYDVADGVATIALDHAETRNALSDAMLDELLEAFAAARDDAAVRCVVLASTHETVFSSGGDLGGFTADAAARRASRRQRPLPAALRAHGPARQADRSARPAATSWPGALGLALACDLVVASDAATFGTPEINVGLFPFMIAALIGRNVGRKKMHELLLLGERIDAAEAAADRPRQPRRPRGRVRRRRRRLGASARGEVAARHAARQGRAVRAAGHGASTRRWSTCARS